mgnify:CR=1 FL=1
MKKFLVLLCLIIFQTASFGADVLEGCYKIYPKDADSLFMTAISALGSDNRYTISEIQSKNGYILFLQGSRYYLLTLTKRYQNQTEIKILPQNSDFSVGNGVAQNVFSLIDLKLKSPMEQIK